MEKIWLTVRKVFFPREASCLSCGSIYGQSGEWLCEACRGNLNMIGVGVFPAEKAIGRACAAYRYEEPAKSMVRSLKYGAVKGLAEEMGRAMAEAWQQADMPDVDLVTNVPMPRIRRMRRGIDHTEELAKVFSMETGITHAHVLARRKRAQTQASLDKKERAKNAKKAFTATDEVDGKLVLLLDDVYTTGATAKNCAKALLRKGAKGVYFVCYARAGGKR